MQRRLILLLWFFTFLIQSTNGQYCQVTALSGPQTIGDNTVTITSGGLPNTVGGPYYFCGVGPYLVGYLSFLGTSPLNYTFDFSSPVTRIRIQVSLMQNENCAIGFSVNGMPYILTTANLAFFSNSCNLNQATITNGNLTYPLGTSGVANGEINIMELNGINSVTVGFVGTLFSNGSSQTIFKFLFGQINVSNNGPKCAGDSLQLWGDTTITEPGSFSWSGPDNFISSEQNPVIYPLTPDDTGIYTMTYITGTDTFTDTTHVTLLPGPAIPEIIVDSPVCAGSMLHLSTPATPGATYTWAGPGGFTAPGPVAEIPNVQDENAGIYQVVASMDGCNPSSTAIVNITHPVAYDFTEVACSGSGYDFNGDMKYEPGIYTDTFPGSNGCDSFSRLHLVIVPAPEINIAMPTEGSFCIGDTIQLTAEGNARSYIWHNNRGDSLGGSAELFFPLFYSSNKVILTGASDNDCTDTAGITIAAEGCCQLSIPNAFSPNGDGLNDCFGPVTNGHIREYQLSVYNRYGQRIFHGFKLSDQWDGTVNGRPSDAGNYYYYITGTCMEGMEIRRKGDITLLR